MSQRAQAEELEGAEKDDRGEERGARGRLSGGELDFELVTIHV